MSEMPPQQPPAITPETLKAQVSELAKNRVVNRDQERIASTALENPDFALLANRALNQGTDPELLRRTVPESVYATASRVGLSKEDADKAIELAHTRGPGALPVDSPQEWLWLILAKYSLDEATKPKEPEKVLAASARMIVAFETYAASNSAVEGDARAFRTEMLVKVTSVGNAPQGIDIPMYESDLGFYAAYRSGKHIAAVKSKDGLTFYGTDGSVTLEEAKIKVDKPLSPHFGIVFPPKTEGGA